MCRESQSYVGMEVLAEWLPFLTSARHASSDGRFSTAGSSNEDDLHDLNTSNDGFADDQGISISTYPSSLESSVVNIDCGFDPVQAPRENGHASPLASPIADKKEDTQGKIQNIRIKFLRILHRLDQTPYNVVVDQVLYRLGVAEQIGGRDGFPFGYDTASEMAEQQEAAGQEDLDFTCTILVLGKTGVGKSATINSIFDEFKAETDAFQPVTKEVKEIVGTIYGIKVRIIDTPGLMSSSSDYHKNKAIMSSVKKFLRKHPPDIVLYLDRLDLQNDDYSDFLLLKIITETFGAAIWFNAILVLTHSSSDPPDGTDRAPLSYEMFVAHRSHPLQHLIRQAAGDMRLTLPVSLVENCLSSHSNGVNESIITSKEVWKAHLLLLCFASKVLGEANAILKLKGSIPGRQYDVNSSAPSLPYLLSSLLQSRSQPHIPYEQGGDEGELYEGLEELFDSEGEDEYDRLTPFKPLSKSELSNLSKDQRRAYFSELEYREKLFQKRQWKEELRRQKAKKSEPQCNKDELGETDEGSTRGEVAVAMPDIPLPPSFQSDNPTYRYRYLDTPDQWLVRPVLNPTGWDHDCGYDGVNAEKMFVIGKFNTASISGQILKDKLETNIQLDCVGSLKHGDGKVTSAGLDVQTVGKNQTYTLHTKTNFSYFKGNKILGGFALALLQDTLAAGMQLEDRVMIGKRWKFILNGCTMMGCGDVACGLSLEGTLRDKDYPIGQSITKMSLSIIDWHGDLAIGANMQSQFSLGRNLMMLTQAKLNSSGSGQVCIRASSSQHLHMALIGMIPLIKSIMAAKRSDFS
ncbi:hypothetical protein SUGI_0259250 [Cryptomeria japonica]|uniref:translocase of chloroplast 108, chloroplastic n=1 Tax=Cryptomeria japonica TaxID=3369 RepID=UPI002408DEBA|nr:translocase of chloroplast 108, chloroplastic [Cryptomeria japonica]GLJ15753.1 hypothetical protein SUGI_0259250 [Cryptomeria japonica]